jgi:signal transduction histidine kinase
MKPITDPVCEQGLRFFGTTTASISHELKNALAIIKENAGLLKDYMAMMEKGSPVTPDRMKVVAGRIEDQVQRADLLIKSMNQYAHTVDDRRRMVDLNDLVSLLVTISQRPAMMRQVGLRFLPSTMPVKVNTAPFFLLTLLSYYCNIILSIVTPGDHLVIGVTAEPAAAIYLELPAERISANPESFTAEPSELLSALNVSIDLDSRSGRITVGLP